MAAHDGAEQAARSRALLGEDGAKPALHGEGTWRGAAPVGGVVSEAAASVRAKAADCGAGQPRASANSGAIGLGGRVCGAGGQGDSDVGVGVVSGRCVGSYVWAKAGDEGDSGAGPVRAISRALAGAAAGAGLLAP